MKEFHHTKKELEFVAEESNMHVYIQSGKNMLLIFNSKVTTYNENTKHDAIILSIPISICYRTSLNR